MTISSASKLYSNNYTSISQKKVEILLESLKNYPDQKISTGLDQLGLFAFFSPRTDEEIKVAPNLSTGGYSISSLRKENDLLEKCLTRYAFIENPYLEEAYREGSLGEPKVRDTYEHLHWRGSRAFAENLRNFLNELTELQGTVESTGTDKNRLTTTYKFLNKSKELRKVLDFAITRAESKEIQEEHKEIHSESRNNDFYLPLNTLDIKLSDPQSESLQTVLRITHAANVDVLGDRLSILMLESPGIFRYISTSGAPKDNHWLSLAPLGLGAEMQLSTEYFLEGLPSEKRDWVEKEIYTEYDRGNLIGYLEEISLKLRKSRIDSLHSKEILAVNRALHAFNQSSKEMIESARAEFLEAVRKGPSLYDPVDPSGSDKQEDPGSPTETQAVTGRGRFFKKGAK